MGFEKALRAVKVIKDQIQYESQSLLNSARGYFSVQNMWDSTLIVIPQAYVRVLQETKILVRFAFLLPAHLCKIDTIFLKIPPKSSNIYHHNTNKHKFDR